MDQQTSTVARVMAPSARLRARITLGSVLAAAAPGIAGGFPRMDLWGTLVLATLLVHELGHGLASLAFGSRATMVIRWFGGQTQAHPPLPPRRAVIAHFMGPFVSLAVGIGLAALRVTSTQLPWWVTMAMWLNLLWGVMNLLPILPFDGGRALLEAFRQRTEHALSISTSLAFGMFVTAIAFRSGLAILVFGMAAGHSAWAWLQHRRERRDAAEPRCLAGQLSTASLLLRQGNPAEARIIADQVAKGSCGTDIEARALELVAWCYLELGHPNEREMPCSEQSPRTDSTHTVVRPWRTPAAIRMMQSTCSRIVGRLATVGRTPSACSSISTHTATIWAERANLPRTRSRRLAPMTHASCSTARAKAP